jgi:hypothetical protein
MSERAAHVADLRECSTGELEHAYGQLDALENAVRAERLQIIAVLDEREVGRRDGCSTTADWVAMTSRLRASTARTQVDTARRLRELPAVSAVATEGRLSWDQLVPLTTIAQPESDNQWAHEGPGYAPATLDAIARGRRSVSTDEALERQRRRSLRWWTDDRIGMLRLSGRIPDTDGQTIIAALQRIVDGYGADADGTWTPGEQRHADALVELASASLAADADHDRACVVVHVRAGAAPVVGETDVTLATETARRLVCDATLQALVTDALGHPVGLSTRRRTVSPALVRVLRHRDGCCRFPGCERTRGLHAHHLVHAADGGPTHASNLALVCPTHHRFVHEHGWHVRGDPGRPDGLQFRRPDGRTYTIKGPPLDPNVRARVPCAATMSA